MSAPSLPDICDRLVKKLGAGGTTYPEIVDSALVILGLKDAEGGLVQKARLAFDTAFTATVGPANDNTPEDAEPKNDEASEDVAPVSKRQRVEILEESKATADGDEPMAPAEEESDEEEAGESTELSGLDDNRVPIEWREAADALRAQRRVDKKLGDDVEDDEPFRLVYEKDGGDKSKMKNGHKDVLIQCLVPGCMMSRNRVKNNGKSKSGGGPTENIKSFRNFLSHLETNGHKANLDQHRKQKKKQLIVAGAIDRGETGEDEPRKPPHLPQPSVPSPDTEPLPHLSDDPKERAETLKNEFDRDFNFLVTARKASDGDSDDDGDEVDYEVRCKFCRDTHFDLAAANIWQQLKNHRSSSDHQSVRPSDGQTTILSHFIYKKPAPPPRHWDHQMFRCFGYWKRVTTYGTKRYDTTVLLGDEPGVDWFSTPEPEFTLPGSHRFGAVKLKGTFVHRLCRRVSDSGVPFDDFTCNRCASIPRLDDFKKRLQRRTEDSHSISNGARLDQMPRGALLTAARTIKQQRDVHRRDGYFLATKLAAAQARAKSWRSRVRENAKRGEVKRLTDELTAAYARGKFKGKRALFNFLKDMIHSVHLGGDDGERSHGMRWSESTHRIYAVLMKIGGPRTVNFLYDNVGGPHASTIQRYWRKYKFRIRPGLNKETIVYTEKIYFDAKQQRKIDYAVPCQASEDETNILMELRWNQHFDALPGTWGPRGPDHRWQEHELIVVGDDAESYEKMVDACSNRVRGGYCRAIIINPLHPDLPKLVVMVQVTWNRFTAVDVRDQWNRLYELWNRSDAGPDGNLATILGPLIGHGSDGDARRFQLQLADMRSTTGRRFKIDWHGLTLSGYYDERDVVRGLHAQDIFHNAKKLLNATDLVARILKLGDKDGLYEHVKLVFEKFEPAEHGIRARDAKRVDRQNVDCVQRVVGRKCRECLKRLPSSTGADGTEAWLEMISRYLLAHFGKKITLVDRCYNLWRVLSLLRLSRNWIGHSAIYNFQEHYIARPSFNHVFLSCQSSIFTIKLCRELGAPVHLGHSGSDCLESFFSSLGGCGKFQHNRRNYDFDSVLQSTGDHNTFEMFRSDPDPEVALQFRRLNSSMESFIHKDEDETLADASLTDYPTDQEIIDAWQRALRDEQQNCARLGIKGDDESNPPRWFTHPEDEDNVYELRDADASDDAEFTMHSATSTGRGTEGDDEDEQIEEIDLTVDGVGLRGEVRHLFDLAEQDADDGPASTKVSVHVSVPGGRRAHKQTVMVELNQLKPGQDLPTDRLARIAKAASSSESIAGAPGVFDEEEPLEPQFGLEVDFAMAFHKESSDDDADEIFWAVGHCMRMKGRRASAGSRQLWRDPFPLSERPDVHVIAKWYQQVPEKPLQFKLDVDDSRGYDMQHVITIVHLDYDENTGIYSMAEDTRMMLDATARSLERSKASNASAQLLESRRRRAAEVREDHSNMRGNTLYQVTGTTRFGRQTTRAVYT